MNVDVTSASLATGLTHTQVAKFAQVLGFPVVQKSQYRQALRFVHSAVDDIYEEQQTQVSKRRNQ